jgi:hypothetical protein
MSQGTKRLRLLFYLPTWPGGKKSVKSKKPKTSPHIHIHQQKKKKQKENSYDYDLSVSNSSDIYIQGHQGEKRK